MIDTLPLNQPLDLNITLNSGQVFRWRINTQGWDGFIDDHLITIKNEDSLLKIQCSPDLKPTIKQLVSQFFRLDDDIEEIYKFLGKDPKLKKSICEFYGLRLIRQNPWECLISFICSANMNIARNISIQESLANNFGKSVQLINIKRNTFPTPEALYDAGITKLQEIGLGYRAKYVWEASRMVRNGTLKLEQLKNDTYHNARTELLNIPGVGRKVADCILLFSLDKVESFPIDRWISKAINNHLYLSDKRYDYLAEKARKEFGKLAGYAQQYLFLYQRSI
jgi:N-glycosylase/DNA lyase